jgi:hypothetical protein
VLTEIYGFIIAGRIKAGYRNISVNHRGELTTISSLFISSDNGKTDIIAYCSDKTWSQAGQICSCPKRSFAHPTTPQLHSRPHSSNRGRRGLTAKHICISAFYTN